MKKEAQENALQQMLRKKKKLKIFNKADGLIFQTEKQLKEFGEKLSADKKAAIEAAHGELKTAFEAKNADDVKAKTEALDAAWMAASEELYAAGQQLKVQMQELRMLEMQEVKMYRMQTSKK
jgi:molecular chaperone DnaK